MDSFVRVMIGTCWDKDDRASKKRKKGSASQMELLFHPIELELTRIP
jgi:hypothetical protein